MNILLQIDKSSNKANNICNLENETFQGKSEIGDILFSNDDILGEKIIYIGREVYIENDKIIDLLAVDEHGRILVFELSTEVAPRNIIAQVLEYISYIKNSFVSLQSKQSLIQSSIDTLSSNNFLELFLSSILYSLNKCLFLISLA